MATVPSAAAQFAGQQTNPLESIARIVQLKNALAQGQLIPGEVQAQQQGLQSGALDLQEKQLQVASREAQMKALAKNFNYGADAPDNSNQPAAESGTSPNTPVDTTTAGEPGTAGGETAPKAATYSAGPTSGPVLSTASPSPAASDFTNKMWSVYGDMMHSGQVLPNDLFNFAGGILKQQKDFADLSKTQQDVNLNQLKNAKDLASQGLAITNPAEQAQFWQDTQQRLRNDPEAASLYSPSLVQHVLNTPYPGEEALGRYFTAIRGSEAALADEKSRLDNLGQQQKVAPLPLATAAATQAEIDARLHVLNPKGGLNPSFRLPPNATQADVDRMDAQLKALEGSSPELAGRKAGAEAAARLPSEEALQTHAIQLQQALLPTALKGVDPHLAGAAMAQASKVNQDYVQAASSAQEMQSLIDLAQKSGNKLAYAYEPTTGVLTINSANGTKRVNMAEIQNYGAAGSALDRIQGWLGKQLTGKSIPDNILNDMAQVHGTLANVSEQKYHNGLQAIDSQFGSQFGKQAITLPSTAVTPAANRNTPQVASHPNGATGQFTANGKQYWTDGKNNLGPVQ